MLPAAFMVFPLYCQSNLDLAVRLIGSTMDNRIFMLLSLQFRRWHFL